MIVPLFPQTNRRQNYHFLADRPWSDNFCGKVVLKWCFRPINLCYTPAVTKKSEPATKDDVEKIVHKVVAEVVGDVATEILNVMAERFAESDARHEAAHNHIENILRPTADKVDDHEVRIKRLEHQTA